MDDPVRHQTLSISLATENDRNAIYRLRHAVYAAELGQHQQNSEGTLRDSLDDYNQYIVARLGDQVIGFVSITPPGHESYSIEKYLSRNELPFPCDDGLYEVRLLTVTKPFRGGRSCALLMYAALRWVEANGGTRLIGMGYSKVLKLYPKAGFRLLGRQINAGAVTFELMTTLVSDARKQANRQMQTLRSLHEGVDWQLGIPFFAPETCHHGGAFFEAIGVDFATLDRRSEIINADVLDAWFPPAPQVLTALESHLSWILRTSPPTHCAGMVQAIATARGIPVTCIVPGAGSSNLIFLAFREWLTPSSRVLMLDPSYGEYTHIMERVIRCRVDRLRLHRDEGYELDLSHLESRFGDGYDLIVLVNPNNPTGRHISQTDLENLLGRAPASTRFWIDEAYLEYVGSEHSLEKFAAASKNVVVCKSMSKVYALSGVRAAYLCAPEPLADRLLALTPPWAVSLAGQIAAVMALGDPQYYHRRYQETHRLRGELIDALRSLPKVEVVPSVANYVLCHLPEQGPSAARVVDRCREQGLFIRDVASMSDRTDVNAFRVAVKQAKVNRQVVKILDDVLSA